MTKPVKPIEATPQKPMCGIIMPIADHPEYNSGHWKEVLVIIAEALESTRFEARLVSDDVAIGLIHERIVNNIYNDDIIICDVSSKNPNVMFELGLRLAFDKPTIIIKDEKTSYSFDTGVIEHINYPSSLRFGQIQEFKKELVKRLNATYDKSLNETNYSPFLKSFGKTIVPASIQQTDIAESKYILEKLESLSNDLKSLRINQQMSSDKTASERQKLVNLLVREFCEKNPLFDEMEIKNVFGEILEEEAKKRFGFRAIPGEIAIAAHTVFNNKKKPAESE